MDPRDTTDGSGFSGHTQRLMSPSASHPGGTGCVHCPYSGGPGECRGRRESLRDPHGPQHPQQGAGFLALFHPLCGPGEAEGGEAPGRGLAGVSTHLPSAQTGRMERGDEKELVKQSRKQTEAAAAVVGLGPENPQPIPQFHVREFISLPSSHEARGCHLPSFNYLCSRAASLDMANMSGHSPS